MMFLKTRVITKKHVLGMLFSLMLLPMVAFASSEYKGTETVNINRANAATLAAYLKGIGPNKAEAIVKYRKANGNFKNAADLKNVPGIGDETYNELKRHVSTSRGKSTAPKDYKMGKSSGKSKATKKKKLTSSSKKNSTSKSASSSKSESSKSKAKKLSKDKKTASTKKKKPSTAKKSSSQKTKTTKASTSKKKSTKASTKKKKPTKKKPAKKKPTKKKSS